MSQLHPNVLTHLAAIDAFSRNGVTAVADHVRAAFVYRMPGRSIVDAESRGVAGEVADGQVFLSDPDQVEDFWAATIA